MKKKWKHGIKTAKKKAKSKKIEAQKEPIKSILRPSSQIPRFYTVKGVSGALSLEETTVRRILKRGALPYYKFGSSIRIRAEDQPHTAIVDR